MKQETRVLLSSFGLFNLLLCRNFWRGPLKAAFHSVCDHVVEITQSENLLRPSPTSVLRSVVFDRFDSQVVRSECSEDCNTRYSEVQTDWWQRWRMEKLYFLDIFPNRHQKASCEIFVRWVAEWNEHMYASMCRNALDEVDFKLTARQKSRINTYSLSYF